MATTAIWKVKGWLGKVLIYAENPEKTDNPAFYQNDNLTQEEKRRYRCISWVSIFRRE